MQSTWYKKCYRRSLVDMHIHHWDDEFLSEFSAEDYLAYLKEAKMQSAMIYLQSHVGLCYYPTKSGIMHKSFIGREDEMRRLVDMCHENGIKVVGYYSLIYNTLEEQRHPEWRIIDDVKGQTSPLQRHVIRYGLCCPNNPGYRDFLKAQIKEIADYFDLDGMFFDMTFWLVVCRCKHCQERWEKETGLKEMPAIDNFKSKESLLLQQKRYDWMADFAKFVHDYAKEVMPHITVSQNNASSVGADYTRGVDERVGDEGCDYMTGDVGGSILMHSFGAKYFRSASHVQPFEYMVIRFPESLAQHTTSITVREFAQVSLLTAAHHGASFMIDSIDPSGTLNPTVAKEIGEAFAMQIPYEPYLDRGVPVSDVAIWYSLRGIYNSEGQVFNTKTASKNLGETLGANHVLYDVIPSVRLDRLGEFKVVFAPAIAGIEKKHIDAVEEYVRNGGTFIFTGVESPELLQRFFGKDVTVEGFTQKIFTYIAPATESGKAMLSPFDEKYPVSLMHRQPMITGVKEDVTVHGKMILPYIDYNDSHNFSAIHSDPPGIKTDYPSFMETSIGKGKAVWLSTPIENCTDRQSRNIVMQILSHYLPEDTRVLTAGRAPMAELVVFKDGGDWLVSAVNVGDAEDRRLVPDFEVKIKSDKAAKAVYLLPEKTPVPHTYENGRIVFTVKELDLFDMYLIET